MQNKLVQLLIDYHCPTGRYLYYPTVGTWDTKKLFDWREVMIKNYDCHKGIDLYIHIPYCHKLCTFCGCNIKVTNDKQDAIQYLAQVMREWKYIKTLISQTKIASITIGGGTPNFFTLD